MIRRRGGRRTCWRAVGRQGARVGGAIGRRGTRAARAGKEAAERAAVGAARVVPAVPGHHLLLLTGADHRGRLGRGGGCSMLVFCLQFLSAIVLRRAWCGWLCPAGGLQELEATAVGKPAKLGWRARVKYVIWVPWVCSIVACAWIAGGFTTVDPLYGIPGGVSMNSPLGLPIYFGIVALFFVPICSWGVAPCATASAGWRRSWYWARNWVRRCGFRNCASRPIRMAASAAGSATARVR